MLTRVKKRLSLNRRMLHLHDRLQSRIADQQSSLGLVRLHGQRCASVA